MKLIFEIYSVSIDFMHQIFNTCKCNERKAPILKRHLCLNLGKNKPLELKLKKCKATYLSIFPFFEAYCNLMLSLKQLL